MNKILAILLSLIMVFSLAACGGGGEEPAGGEEVNNQVENQEEQQEEIPAASTKTLAYFQKFLSGGEYIPSPIFQNYLTSFLCSDCTICTSSNNLP